jgi:hypothetical protein
VTFLNKVSIMRTLAALPRGSHVIIDAGRTVDLDPDVREIIHDEMVRAKDQGITIELTGFRPRDLPKVEQLRGAVIQAANSVAHERENGGRIPHDQQHKEPTA